MSRFMSSVKFDVEKFNEIINFGLWKVQVKNVLIQDRLHKVLKGRPHNGASIELSSDGSLGESTNGSNKDSKTANMRDEDK